MRPLMERIRIYDIKPRGERMKNWLKKELSLVIDYVIYFA